MDRSIANQELFLPDDDHPQDQSQQHGQPVQPRYYADMDNGAVQRPAAAPTQDPVPAVNLIPATPSTIRSDSIRSTASQAFRTQTMHGALPDLAEEDMYGSPGQPEQTEFIPPIPPKSPARFERSSASESPAIDPAQHVDTGSAYMPPHRHDQTSAQPLDNPHMQDGSVFSEPDAGHVPTEPPTYDEYRQARTDEPPPLPGPRPTVSSTDQETTSTNVHPSIHLDSDQDYAYALQLQEEEESRAPPLPTRPRPSAPPVDRTTNLSSHALTAEEQDRALAQQLQDEEDNAGPALPTRPGQSLGAGINEPPAFTRTPSTDQFLPPPRRTATDFGTDNPSDPVHYTRDPHKLIAYLVPFPTPQLKNAPSEAIPKRFLIYTPPPPPLQAPPEGVKEDRTHKVQRKWQDEVRRAKLSEAKTTSWPGFKAKLTRGVSKAMTYTTTSNLDFLGRVNPTSQQAQGSTSPARSPSPTDRKDPLGNDLPTDPALQAHETKKTVGLESMVFVYSPTMNLTPDQMRAEFVNTVMRTKSKAMRDSVIATGLLPVSLAVDIVLIAVSGIFEVNAAWAYFNIKGAKTARSVSKRLASSTSPENPGVPPPGQGQGQMGDSMSTTSTIDPEKPDAEMQKEDKLKLEFRPATRIDVLARYLQAECHKVEPKLFPEYLTPPGESDCLEAIGWAPHQTGSESKNWEDEAWERQEVKDDLKLVMHKAAKEWRKYCVNYEKNPEKNLNK